MRGLQHTATAVLQLLLLAAATAAPHSDRGKAAGHKRILHNGGGEAFAGAKGHARRTAAALQPPSGRTLFLRSSGGNGGDAAPIAALLDNEGRVIPPETGLYDEPEASTSAPGGLRSGRLQPVRDRPQPAGENFQGSFISDTSLREKMLGTHGLPHPTVVCLGMVKSGTTDLYDVWVRLFANDFNLPAKKELGMMWRKDLLSDSVLPKYHRLLNVSGPNPYTIDFTPGYIWTLSAPFMASKLIALGTRFIVMVRDPVGMVLSWLNYRKGRAGRGIQDGIMIEELDADEVLLTELALLQQPETYAKLLRSMTSMDASEGRAMYEEVASKVDTELGRIFGDNYRNVRGFVLPGLYAPVMRMWIDKVFSHAPGQSLLILADAWFDDRRATLTEAIIPFMFGNEWMPDEETLDMVANLPVSNTVAKTKKASSPVKCMLAAFFEPFNCAFAALLRNAGDSLLIYPRDRLDTVGCQLWPDSDAAALCGAGDYSERVAARVAT